ncbi:MAG: 3-hydroxybutyryl-CoA dehydrogenase, partial [Spirochaetaceae bacterium]|nr:3-hydroxybutyryl-CoA dehydrogenase [Spirochaetaceae bacterium]
PGFIVNRLVIPLINEAAIVASENTASAEDIDTAMMLGAAHPMGPLALADMIGIDIVVDILETLAADLGEEKYKPCELLYNMIAEGKLGKKTGSGFYEYLSTSPRKC